MAEVTSIKTAKPPVEFITVKLSRSEALELVKTHRAYYGSSALARTLEDAANGKTAVLDPLTYALKSYADFDSRR